MGGALRSRAHPKKSSISKLNKTSYPAIEEPLTALGKR
jgi:hypothetical protein